MIKNLLCVASIIMGVVGLLGSAYLTYKHGWVFATGAPGNLIPIYFGVKGLFP